jgi:hypothetical protein
VADRRFNAKLILPDGTEKPSLIVYYPPTLTGEEVEDIGRQILAVFSGTLCSDVEDEEGRGTTTEDMLDAGVLDADGVQEAPAPKPPQWPAGLLDRIKAAEQRIADNHAPRRIPADPHGDVDLVLAEVRYLIEGCWPPFWIKDAAGVSIPAPISYTDEPWQDAICAKFAAAGFKYDGFGGWQADLTTPEMIALGVALGAPKDGVKGPEHG